MGEDCTCQCTGGEEAVEKRHDTSADPVGDNIKSQEAVGYPLISRLLDGVRDAVGRAGAYTVDHC